MSVFAKWSLENICKYSISVLFIITMTACERVDEYDRPVAFFTSSIYDDCKRIPLVYPFEIIDSNENVELTRWDEKQNGVREVLPNSQFSYILRFAQTNNYVFGERDIGWVRPCGETQYFVFSLAKTNVVRFSDQKDFSRYCAKFGGNIKQMRPFLEQWKDYWLQNAKQNK